MPYSAEISRSSPACFIFVIDQSGSMADEFGGEIRRPKAQGVADAVNRLVTDLTIKCAKQEGVRDYYHVAVIGYGEKGAHFAFGGNLAGRGLVPLSELANNPARIETRKRRTDDGAGGITEQSIKFPVWFDPSASGGTPMRAGLRAAADVAKDWVGSYPNGFPPIVIHITDGESTDGDPSAEMSAIKELSTSDGAVLLFNIHLSSADAGSLVFPNNLDGRSDPFARLLFEGASALTDFMRHVALEQGLRTDEGAKSFVMNADLVMLIQALTIGTRPSNLR
jgi:hypothetical protein